MKTFIDQLSDLMKELNLNVYNVVEIRDGVINQRTITPTSNCINGYSVSKAFVVTAIGFLVDENRLNLESKVVDILEEYLPKKINDEYRSLTVDQALRHRMGLPSGYLDIDVYPPSQFGKDFLSNVFCSSPVSRVGQVYAYTDAAYYVLSRVVEKVADMPIEDFLRERLFNRLQFRETAWSKCPMGHAMGATGLYLTTVDMAKLGLLYLQKGVYDGKRILSDSWVDTVLNKGYEFKDCYQGKCYGKGGMYNQMLLVLPHQNRVVAYHSFDEKDFSPIIKWICEYQD